MTLDGYCGDKPCLIGRQQVIIALVVDFLFADNIVYSFAQCLFGQFSFRVTIQAIEDFLYISGLPVDKLIQ